MVTFPGLILVRSNKILSLSTRVECGLLLLRFAKFFSDFKSARRITLGQESVRLNKKLNPLLCEKC